MKSIKKLKLQVRKFGFRGYSKLIKNELIKLLRGDNISVQSQKSLTPSNVFNDFYNLFLKMGLV